MPEVTNEILQKTDLARQLVGGKMQPAGGLLHAGVAAKLVLPVALAVIVQSGPSRRFSDSSSIGPGVTRGPDVVEAHAPIQLAFSFESNTQDIDSARAAIDA